MKCPCSMIPPDFKIIKVGDSEVGIHDLKKIMRKVYHLGIEDESSLKEELLTRVKEKNYISEKRQDLYAEVLLREYYSFAKTQWPIRKSQGNKNKSKPSRSMNFFKRRFGTKRNKV